MSVSWHRSFWLRRYPINICFPSIWIDIIISRISFALKYSLFNSYHAEVKKVVIPILHIGNPRRRDDKWWSRAPTHQKKWLNWHIGFPKKPLLESHKESKASYYCLWFSECDPWINGIHIAIRNEKFGPHPQDYRRANGQRQASQPSYNQDYFLCIVQCSAFGVTHVFKP